MRKSSLFIFGIILLSILIVSCHKGRNKLVGSWKTTAVEAKKPLTDSIKNEILAKGNLSFTEDGHVTGFLEDVITEGTFVLSNGGKTLVIEDKTGTPYPCESTITDEELILNGEKMILTLKKI